ncbi:HD domain-containing protein [Cytobacillus sp. IB215665]|uniref:HD domain-containing protein n=1 Tax=Cytobacillus sp. IB215665 TaxID=3097357 RepID=UPI002A1071A7|nr:HD domain-containing protein [Cytobacillus sp. IB215665]MDX8365371.1 HD domain-containing protein [Cytobacillus sp. IB215665]
MSKQTMINSIKHRVLTKACYLTIEELLELEIAIAFAEKAHEGQMRATGEPYIVHPLSVCLILLDYKADAITLISAVLHDVVEDTIYTVFDIKNKFGLQVSLIVDGLTKIAKGSYEKDEYNAINREKLLSAIIDDVRVAVIKIVDRLHNMRTLQVKKVEKKVPYASETLAFFSPLTERLGLVNIQKELESLSFHYMNPVKYEHVKQQMCEHEQSFFVLFNKCKQEIEHTMKTTKLGLELYWDTMPIYKYNSMLQEDHSIVDTFSINVVTNSFEDCYIAFGIIHNLFQPISNEFKDHMAIRNNIFYKHLKTKVLIKDVEVKVNIYTKAEQHLKNLGVFQFLQDNLFASDAKKISKDLFRDSISCIKVISKNPTQFGEMASFEILQNDITVYTSHLEPVYLPDGSTAIDYAFQLDPSIAKRISYVCINGKVKPLNTVLIDSDIVEIAYAEKDSINPHWLSFTKTSKAYKEISDLLG